MEYENENYNDEINNNNYDNYNNYRNKKKSFPIGIIIGIILIIVLIFFFLKSCNKNNNTSITNISLVSNSLNLKVGDIEQIKLTSDSEIDYSLLHFTSNNEEIATIDNQGYVTAISEGNTIISIQYTNNKKDTYYLDCYVEVEERKIIYEINNSEWSNENVIITFNPDSNKGLDNIKYAINCKENCQYKDVIDNQITIEEDGTNEIKIIATNTNGKQIEEVITAKVDKQEPNIELNIKDSTIYNNNEKVEVCGTCTDNESGCEKDKECKEYTQTISKETISISDKSGNKGTSKEFNVIFDTTKPHCIFLEPNEVSNKIEESFTLTLECTDDISGIKNSDIYVNNIEVTSKDIIEITNIKKTTIQNGFQYIITLKGKQPGKTNISIINNTIIDNANNGQETVISNNINILANCTWKQTNTSNTSSCTAVREPEIPNEGDTYVTCEGPYYGKWRFNGFKVTCANNGKTMSTGASSYSYTSSALAEQACQEAWRGLNNGCGSGGVSPGPSSVCKASRYTYYKKTTYTCGTENITACTRNSSCGCESYSNWKSQGTQQFNQSCNSSPEKTSTTKRWTGCVPSVQPNTPEICTWTCQYAIKTCNQYKCC